MDWWEKTFLRLLVISAPLLLITLIKSALFGLAFDWFTIITLSVWLGPPAFLAVWSLWSLVIEPFLRQKRVLRPNL